MEAKQDDFSAERSRHLVFFERHDVFDHIDHLFCEGTKWVVVTGCPGIGKSAVVLNYLLRLETAGFDGRLAWAKSWLSGGTAASSPVAELASHLITVKQGSGRRIVPHHVLRWGYKDWAVRDAVRQSLAAQVGALAPALIDPSDHSEQQLANLLDRLSSDVLLPEHKRLILVIDGIDQFEGEYSVNPLFDLLPVELPDGVSVLCSARSTHADMVPLDWAPPMKIDLDAAEWTESNDVVRRAMLDAHAQKIGVPVEYADEAKRRAAGNIRYLGELLSSLAENARTPLDRVPYPFRAYAEDVWQFVDRFKDRQADVSRRGLRVLSDTPDWMSMTELASRAAWTESDDAELFLRAARPVLLQAESEDVGTMYRLFHPSFAEVVTSHLVDASTALMNAASSMFRAMTFPSTPPALVLDTLPVRDRYALLIGINDYVEPGCDLRYCVNDVVELEQRLSGLGYTVASLHDNKEEKELWPTLFNVRAALAKLKDALHEEDLLLVFFAGHGRLVDGRPYLLARDSRVDDPTFTALALKDVEMAMRATLSRRLLLILDACHEGVNLGRDVQGTPGPNPPVLEPPEGLDPDFFHNAYELAEGFAMLAGSTAQQRTQDFDGVHHGVFTYFLLEALSGKADLGVVPKGFVTVNDLNTYLAYSLRKWVFQHQKQMQLPTARIEGVGDMIVAYTQGRP